MLPNMNLGILKSNVQERAAQGVGLGRGVRFGVNWLLYYFMNSPGKNFSPFIESK